MFPSCKNQASKPLCQPACVISTDLTSCLFHPFYSSSLCLFSLILPLLGQIYSLLVSLLPPSSEVSLHCDKSCLAIAKPGKKQIFCFLSPGDLFRSHQSNRELVIRNYKAGRYAISFTLGGGLVNRRPQLKAGRRACRTQPRNTFFYKPSKF